MLVKSKSIIIILFMLVLFSVSSFAGGNSGQIGIGFTVTESTPSFLLHVWASESFTLSPIFSLQSVSDPEIKRYSFGLSAAYHFKPGESFRPLIGFGITNDVISGSGGDNSFSDLYLGPFLGAEYYFSDNFSVMGIYALEIIQTNDDLSPSMLQTGTTYITTNQLLTIQYYF